MSKVIGDPKGVQMLVTNRGNVVTRDILKAYETEASSKQITESMFKYGQTIDPPYDLVQLMKWMDQNVVHASCILTKVQDTVGMGFTIDPREEEEDGKDGAKKDSEYNSLMDFFKNVNGKESITQLLKKVMIDYEGCGNGYIEVARGKEGKISALYHVNATTIKWAKEKDRLVQKVGREMIWFKLFGDERVLDRTTGKFEKQIADIDKIANEIIPIVQYTWMSAVYGMPEWLPAVRQMFGDLREAEYNLDFFENYGVPAYALILEGGPITEEIQDEVTKFFETKLKNSNHKTLTLSTAEGVKLRFERLSVESKESSFRMYHKDNRDAILTAHRVPPYRAAIVEQGQLGGNVAGESDRIYLDSVVNPRQAEFAWVINELIIKKGLEIEKWIFEFEDINIEDAAKQSDIHFKYFNMGVMSPNEIRAELGLEPYEGGDDYFMSGAMIAVGAEPTPDGAVLPKPEEEEIPEGAAGKPGAAPEGGAVGGAGKPGKAPAGTPSEGLSKGQKNGREEIDVPAKGKV